MKGWLQTIAFIVVLILITPWILWLVFAYGEFVYRLLP